MMTKKIGTIMGEGLVVGLGIAALGYGALATTNAKLTSEQKNKVLLALFISGFSFHIICEYTGINAWYSNDYVAKQERFIKIKNNLDTK
jgi:hypothetical protein